MNEPKYTGRNVLQNLLLDYIRARSRASKFPVPEKPLEFQGFVDDAVKRVAAGEAVEIADESLKAWTIATLCKRNYVEQGGKHSLDYRHNRDARALLANKNLTPAMGNAVATFCGSPLICRIRTKGARGDISVKAPTNFSRKPIDPARLETIEFHGVVDEDAPID